MAFRRDGPDGSDCRIGCPLLRIYLALFFAMLYYLNVACVYQKKKTKNPIHFSVFLQHIRYRKCTSLDSCPLFKKSQTVYLFQNKLPLGIFLDYNIQGVPIYTAEGLLKINQILNNGVIPLSTRAEWHLLVERQKFLSKWGFRNF